jgi:hypothetical protein
MSAAEAEKPAVPCDPLAVSDEEVDAVIQEAKVDPRGAIRMLIRDLAMMAVDADSATSRGFLRGRIVAGVRRQAVDCAVQHEGMLYQERRTLRLPS